MGKKKKGENMDKDRYGCLDGATRTSNFDLPDIENANKAGGGGRGQKGKNPKGAQDYSNFQDQPLFQGFERGTDASKST